MLRRIGRGDPHVLFVPVDEVQEALVPGQSGRTRGRIRAERTNEKIRSGDQSFLETMARDSVSRCAEKTHARICTHYPLRSRMAPLLKRNERHAVLRAS